MPHEPSETRLAELRRQIAAGTYETPEKLDIAVERLLHNLTSYDIQGSDTQDSETKNSDLEREPPRPRPK